MNAILLGPQGVGKGTQGEIIAERLRMALVGTGVLLRAAIAAGTPLGAKRGPTWTVAHWCPTTSSSAW
jgi:adenylate kinase